MTKGTEVLKPRAGAGARREAVYLLAGVLGTSLGRVELERERRLSAAEASEYEARLARRLRGEPLQYIEGRAAFRQLSLRVDRSVLIPRPETEQLVEYVLDWSAGREGLRALDLGTGSGAIAISLLQEGPFAGAVAVDISPEALKVARYNALEIGVAEKLDLRLGSLFQVLGAEERFDVVVSNPPYVAWGERQVLPVEVRDWEPPVALFAGTSGLEFIEPIVETAPRHLSSGGLLALEIAPPLAPRATELVRARAAYDEPRVEKDLSGQSRILLALRV